MYCCGSRSVPERSAWPPLMPSERSGPFESTNGRAIQPAWFSL